MRVPLSWLSQYVPITVAPEELAHRLTMAGIEVGDVEAIGGDWDRGKLLVGKVLRVEKHPNADRLTLPSVDLGDGETVSVVCGAPNVAAGQKVAFAREGARLVNPHSREMETLKAARIRGVMSAGMVCSALELGLGDDHEGIVVLPDDAPVGTPLLDYLGDVILDIEVTPNRPDCLSVLGVAHEVAALTGQVVTEPDLSYDEEGGTIDVETKIEIVDPDLCPRYTASLITGIEIGPSPRWMQDALTKSGQRPINNVVDITNYVMLEYGQPLHAFDFDRVKEKTIIVRAARSGERLVTLDGEERILNPPVLTIADATDAVALAGVMGGANSEMHAGTTSVLLESASFDPVNTRRTAASLRLNTEASHRFERGIRAELAPQALRRATQLILQVAGGQAASGIVDLYPGRQERPPVRISSERIKQILGVELGMDQVEAALSSLGLSPTKEPEAVIDPIEHVDAALAQNRETTLWMDVPYWRSDLSIEDDLVEEVARIIGYDSIPTTMLSTSMPHHEPQPMRELKERLKDLLAARGMREVISYSLTSLETLEKADVQGKGPPLLMVANPPSGEVEYLRTGLRGSVLQTLAANRRVLHGEGVSLFEIGRVYLREAEREGDLPDEREMLVGAISGPRFVTSWQVPPGDAGFFDAKGVLESVFRETGVAVEFRPSSDPVLHPGRTARILHGEDELGVVGEVAPRVLGRFDLEEVTVALFEVDMEALSRALPPEGRRYQAAGRFPQSHRDLALFVDAGVPSARVQAIIENHGLVVRAVPFDVYTGEGVPQGKTSVAYRVTFQSSSGTLTAEQVNRAQEETLRRLRSEVGAQLRL